MTELEAIIRDLAGCEPRELEWGDCTLCGENAVGEGSHAPSCPYVRAVKWCEENPA